MNVWANILVGGGGTRLRPATTRQRPKPLLRLPDPAGPTLFAQTLTRLDGFIPAERRLATVTAELAAAFRGGGDAGRVGHWLLEPCGRGTGPALILAARWLAARDPRLVVVNTPADQWVGAADAWRSAAAQACELAVRGFLVLIGVRLRRPDPGYGYILPGRPLHAFGWHVERFREKPSVAEAADWLAQGALANGGVFVWRPAAFCEVAAELRADWAAAAGSAQLAAAYAALAPGGVDREIIERVPERLAVVALEAEWDDLGTWPRVRERMIRLGRLDPQAPFVWSAGHDVRARGSGEHAAVVTDGTLWATGREHLADLAADSGV